jgi:hypothetical protein
MTNALGGLFGLAGPSSWSWQGGNTLNWYLHWIYPFSTELEFRYANYIFVERQSDGTRVPLYIGETGDTGIRFRTHEKFAVARLYGANEIHIHYGGARRDRLDVETDLRAGHYAALNAQNSPAKRSVDALIAALMGPPSSPYSLPAGGVAGFGNVFGSLAPEPTNALAGFAPSPWDPQPTNALAPRHMSLGEILAGFGKKI